MIFALFWKDDHTHTSCHNSKDSEFISKAKKKKIIEKYVLWSDSNRVYKAWLDEVNRGANRD